MSTTSIFCGICGKAEQVSLLGHIREVHAITPDEYAQRCPNAPLFVPEFGDHLRQRKVHIDGDAVLAMHELLGSV